MDEHALRPRILDGMCLVEDDTVELHAVDAGGVRRDHALLPSLPLRLVVSVLLGKGRIWIIPAASVRELWRALCN